MAGTYGEPGKNTFAIPGVGGILSPVVNDTTGVTQVYRGGAATTQKSLGTYNPTTNKFTPDTNAGLTPSEIKALSSEANLKTLKNKASETVSKGVQAAGGTPEKGQAAANKLLSPNKADNPDASGDTSQPAGEIKDLSKDLSEKIKSSGNSREKTGSFGNYRYPEDIANTKQDVIKFTMLKYEPRKIAKAGSLQGGDLGGLEDRSTTNRNILGSVILPIPSGISETNACDWGSESMNPGELLLANVALQSITGGLQKGAGVLGAAAAGAAGPSNTEVKAAATSFFAEQAAGVRGLLSRTGGAIFNPNLELLFNAPSLRPFSFTFKMSARSDKEAKQIIKIIRFFKQGMSPQKSDSNLFLRAPHTFKVQYLYRPKGSDADHPFIGAIKECALQSFTVNYTPEGQYATFYDGVLVSYEIQMQFTELEPVFNEDYGNTGNEMPFDLLFRESSSTPKK